uniref:GMP synthase [glutamine-hydrolyzing] n=1 Tax=uncultured bacterium Contig1450 TaxID=1393427 RepID=W0FHC0_9BACT|nr:GMP synthase [uncultured bacterium Contig1450]
MDKILVLDFGGQYNQLIARRVRDQQVYAEIKSWQQITPEEIRKEGYKGIIFTGGPNSVYDPASPHYDPAVLDLEIPILGICYGDQLMAYMAGGRVSSAESSSEYGKTLLKVKEHILFQDVPEESICWMSHTDFINEVPSGFTTIAQTAKCPCAAIADDARKLYGVQFHPEVTHTVYGTQILRNFLFSICACNADWKVEDFAAQLIAQYKEKLQGKKVLLALSGGVDSSVAAVLLHKAVGSNLVCVFVDHGLLRKDEGDFVEKTFKEEQKMNLIRVNAEERFLNKLAGVTDPETKRKIIGEEFIRVFEDEAAKLGKIHVLAQGTIYPDVIESGKGDSAVIKSHHNVGGLPDVISFDEIAEPLRDLFKDEVRAVGTLLGLPKELVYRQPFPGPGLAVRIIGEITKEKLLLLQEADAIFREEIAKAQLDHTPDQYFAVLTNAHSVGVMGDARTYGYVVALRAVETDDFMTAEFSRLPYEVLEKASSRITNEVRGISRVVYDISSKPPSTVEWE